MGAWGEVPTFQFMVDIEAVSRSSRVTCQNMEATVSCSGMADRGMGIRLFNSKEALQRVFEEFESGLEGDLDDDPTSTAVVTSQLRHFVIQVSCFTL